MLLHRLALRLSRTKRELRESIEFTELEDWRLFDLIEPIGDYRHDVLTNALFMLWSKDSQQLLPLLPWHRVREVAETPPESSEPDFKSFMRNWFTVNAKELVQKGKNSLRWANTQSKNPNRPTGQK